MQKNIRKFEKLLVANRGEIAIRVLRAASELKIRTLAMYTHEDRFSFHRYKADEAYEIGAETDPLKPYLDIEEIIKLAKQHKVDAIHPGYGFLSENVNFVRRCKEEGIVFIGPEPEIMEHLGDKVAAKNIARKAGVPVIEDSKFDLKEFKDALSEAHRIGYPVMIKAAAGGGGRGMRVVRDDNQLEKSFYEAKNEAKNAFGDDTIFLEKYIDDPKHIEVQIVGDNYGNIVHLFERDCSVQRRFQKVVEVAPSTLNQETRDKIFTYALKIARQVNYNNVGTIEFLVNPQKEVFFIEVNPRVQVEHTITEEITGVDIVRTQILVARGFPLSDPRIYIKKQEDVVSNGFAIQCRVTTEDPQNNFKPDFGTIVAYRNAGGFGIRLDEGNCYTGVRVSPFFDSMLVKVSSHGRTLKGAAQRLHRALREFRIRGVKTNIGFLENVIMHQTFYRGEATVSFIPDHPELFKITKKFDRATKTLRYIANVIVNSHPDVKNPDPKKNFKTPVIPEFDRYQQYPAGTKNKLTELGRDKFIDWLKASPSIQYTDTTFRDGHQSLLATRVRTFDMLQVAEGFAKNHPEVFSMEVWGGATFDVCMRFLQESPWTRLKLIREAIPNILLQMLLRGSNAVGYKAYPDNLIEKFIINAWESGIDIFRIFDSLNWIENMKFSIRTVRERTEGIAEAAICYTGDLLDPANKKYTLQYYLDLAKQLEDEGAHILAIKDMAGLLKPYAAKVLVQELKKSISIPVHLHTHDTASVQAATYLQAIEEGVDVIDVAIGSLSGLTSQPNFNSMVSILKGHDRELKVDEESLNKYSNYWGDVREYYYPFESGLKSGSAEVYQHEMPGGQYSNLLRQASSLGIEEKFEEVKKNYALVNHMFGDIIKVTPSSKVVGDMALFMTSNNYSMDDIFEKGHTLSFPESVSSFFKGDLGQPPGGFPEKLSKIVLRDEKPYFERPNAHLEPVDFDKEFASFKKAFGEECDFLDFLANKLYPKVFHEFYSHRDVYGDIRYLPTPVFFYGMKMNEVIQVEIAKGKTLIIKLNFVSDPDENGMRTVSFELNGQTRKVEVRDWSHQVQKTQHRKAFEDHEIGTPIQGKISEIKVKEGDKVKENAPLFVIEAMKMETTITAAYSGTISKIHLQEGIMVEQEDLVLEIER